MSIDIHLPASRQVDPNTFVGGESRDFRILKNGGFLSKPRISGKNFFDIPVNTDQIYMEFEANTLVK